MTPPAPEAPQAALERLVERIDAYFKKPNLWYENKVEANAILRAVLAALRASEGPREPMTGETSDGYHTFNELYVYRKAFNALLFNEWARQGRFDVHKSWKHNDGEPCFGGGWFIVSAQTSAGQVTNHYKADDWPLFNLPERELAAAWDGHTPAIALQRLLTLALEAEGRQGTAAAQEKP